MYAGLAVMTFFFVLKLEVSCFKSSSINYCCINLHAAAAAKAGSKGKDQKPTPNAPRMLSPESVQGVKEAIDVSGVTTL